ncbi:MAG: hypothetical protein AAFQ65_15055 [Myxococcota bacterium]
MLSLVGVFGCEPETHCRVEDNLHRLWLQNLCFHPRRLSVWRGQSVSFYCFEAPHPVWKEGAVDSRRDSFFAVQGVPLVPSLDAGAGYTISSLHDFVAARRPESVLDATWGPFSVLHGTTDSMLVYGDVCGRYPWFISRVGSGVVVSNTARVASVARSGFDGFTLTRRAATSLCMHAQIWGNQTLFEGVELVAPDCAMRVDRAGVRYSNVLPSLWSRASNQSPDALEPFDEAANGLTAAFKTMGRLHDGKFRLGLSGGKDSRLMAAAGSASGILDRIDLFTGGREHSPEFLVADTVADALGTTTRHQVAKKTFFSTGAYLERLRHQVGRYDGMLLPLAGSNHCHRAVASVEITGYGGELYRRGLCNRFKRKKLDHVRSAASVWPDYHVPADVGRVCRRSVRKSDARWMRGWVTSQLDQGNSLITLPERFFALYRVPLHQGLAFGATASRVAIDPLISTRLALLHMRHAGFSGQIELTHCVLTERLAPRLARLPYLKARWNPKLDAFFESPVSSPPAFGGRQSDRQIRPIAWRFFEDAPDVVHRFLLAPKSPLYEFVSRSAVRRLVRRPLESTAHANQLFTILGLQLRLAREFERPKDGPKTKVIMPKEDTYRWVRTLERNGYASDRPRQTR